MIIIYLICIVNGELQISVPVQLQLHVHAKFQAPVQCTKEKFCPSNLMTVQNTEILYLYFDIKLIVKSTYASLDSLQLGNVTVVH